MKIIKKIELKKKINFNMHSLQSPDITIPSLVEYLLKNNINFNVNKNTTKLLLINIIRTKIFNLNRLKYPNAVIYRFMLNCYFKKLGNCHLIKNSINTEDLDTCVDIYKIPAVYLFCIKDNTDVYSFDIRTIHNIYLLNKKENTNPYTRNKIDCEILLQVKKKLDFLNKLDFCIYHFYYLKTLNLKFISIDDVIYKLHSLDYNINKEWIVNLSLLRLKKLYFELLSSWSNANLSNEIKFSIINIDNGPIFMEYDTIGEIKKNDKDKLINIIFTIINRLISEGINNDFKRIGALYFLLGLVNISKDARKKYDYLVN